MLARFVVISGRSGCSDDTNTVRLELKGIETTGEFKGKHLSGNITCEDFALMQMEKHWKSNVL